MDNTKFIEECKKRANANRLGQLFLEDTNTTITQSDRLQSFTIDNSCYVNGDIVGSVYIGKLTAQVLDINNLNLDNKVIYAKNGVKYADNTTETVNMGKYIIERPNVEKTANIGQITAYNQLSDKIDDKYVSTIDFSTGNITVKDIYIDLCNQLGMTPKQTEFLNSDIPVQDNPFTNGEKNRVVLQAISKVSCSYVEIDNETNEIDLVWLSESEEPDYTFELNDYATLEGGEVTYGPINSVIIKNSAIDSENVTKTDEESIEAHGEHSLVISEDYILHNAELRLQAIENIFNRLNGLKYVDCKLITYYGKPFLKKGSKIRIKTGIGEGDYFDTYVLSHQFTYDGSFKSVIQSPALTEQEIKTKQNITLGEALKNFQIDVDKQGKKITSLASSIDGQSEEIAQVTQTIKGVQISVSEQQTQINNVTGEIERIDGTLNEMNYNFGTDALNIAKPDSPNSAVINNNGTKLYTYDDLKLISNQNGTGVHKLIVTGDAQIGYLRFVKELDEKNKECTDIHHLVSNIQTLQDLEVENSGNI